MRASRGLAAAALLGGATLLALVAVGALRGSGENGMRPPAPQLAAPEVAVAAAPHDPGFGPVISGSTTVRVERRALHSYCLSLRRTGRPASGTCGHVPDTREIRFLVSAARGQPVVVAGVVGDDVVRLIAVGDRGTEVAAVLRNNAFAVELPRGERLVAFRKVFADGVLEREPYPRPGAA